MNHKNIIMIELDLKKKKKNNGKRPTNFIENAPLNYAKHRKNMPKQFEAPILPHGKQVGTLKGFIQGTAVVSQQGLCNLQTPPHIEII